MRILVSVGVDVGLVGGEGVEEGHGASWRGKSKSRRKTGVGSK